MTTPHVLVIGGGLAGLTAAATAARAGAQVTLIEARRDLGGRARSTVNDAGFVFNQGPHALYRSGAAMPILRGLGIEPHGNQPPLQGYGRLRDRIDRLPSVPKDALRTHLIGLRTKFELGKAIGRPAKLLNTETRNRSLQQWINEQFGDTDARLFIEMLARVATYCSDLDHLDASPAVAQMVIALTGGVIYLDDGWNQLVDGLAKVCANAGVITTTGKVAPIEQTNDQFIVKVEGRIFTADRVVAANGGPSHAAAVMGRLSPSLRARVDECRPVYASCLDLAMSSLPRPGVRFCGGVDEPLYLSVHTPSARLAPEAGGEMLHVMRYGDHPDDARPMLEAFLDDAQPGWRDRVVDERYGKRLVVAHDRPRPNATRFGPQLIDCPGVFVAGDWVGDTGLLADAAIASGAQAGELAAR